MGELVYVLTVEALVLGLCCAVLVAQRLNVFEWPPGRTWPVFAASVQGVLFYAQALLMLSGFIAAGALKHVASDIKEACARCAGRLCTVAFLAVVFVSALVATYQRVLWPCLLCQLWATSCEQPGHVLWSWSYSVYLAVLLPVLALQAGLQVTAAGMHHKGLRLCPHRHITASCAFLLTCNVDYTFKRNLDSGCQKACLVNGTSAWNATSARNPTGTPAGNDHFVTSADCLVLAISLCGADIIADTALAISVSVRGQRVLWTVVYTVAVAAHPLIVVLFDQISYDGDSGILPWPLMLAHTVLMAILCMLDIVDVWQAYAVRKHADPEHESADGHVEIPQAEIAPADFSQANAAKDQQAQMSQMTSPAFEVTPARRKRFVLAFTSKSRWPAQPVGLAKKDT